MVKILVVIFCAVQMLDLATYSMAPQFEANPAMRSLPPMAVAVAKVTGVSLALLIVNRLTTENARVFALGVGIAIGAFCVGANVATISMMR
jgi:hypothetical protein